MTKVRQVRLAQELEEGIDAIMGFGPSRDKTELRIFEEERKRAGLAKTDVYLLVPQENYPVERIREVGTDFADVAKMSVIRGEEFWVTLLVSPKTCFKVLQKQYALRYNKYLNPIAKSRGKTIISPGNLNWQKLFRWVVGHELGHIRYGDVGREVEPLFSKEEKTRNREIEIRADIGCLIGYPPIEVLTDLPQYRGQGKGLYFP